MAGVDNRIVTMKFDNAQFEQGAKTSLSTLEKLKQSMNFGSVGATASKALGGISGLFAKFGVKNPFATAEKGAADLSKAAGSVANGGLTSLDGAVTGVSNKFLAMSTIAITALSNITNKAISTGQQMVSSLTVDPIKGGLEEYETNLNSIQTILANTKVSGATLDDVNRSLDELNTYSDKTIYNFSEMARNIGTFTAAGVDLETSVSSIKGIANLAAVSGSTSQQASTAMYQLSQEIAAGRVSLMGWNSVVNAGMGGSTFQRALVRTAQEFGNLEGKTVSFTGKMKNATIDGQSFRDSIMAKPGEQSWLSNEVLTSTLAQFTGDMTDAELAAQGFSKAQIKEIQAMAKTAQDAATKVKTLSGVFDTAQEVVGSGWAKTWQLIFGDFKEARKFFTGFSIGLNDIIDGFSDRRNEMLAEWKLGGGRDAAIEGLKTGWEAVYKVLQAVSKGFRDIFPAKTSADLLSMTDAFVEFTKKLMPSKDTLRDIRDIAGGVFAVFGIGKQILGGVVTMFKTIFSSVGAGNGNFLSFAATIGNVLKGINDFLKESGLITAFFTGLGKILSVPLALLQGVGSVISSIFGGFDEGTASKVGDAVDGVGKRLSGLQVIGEKLQAFFSKIGDFFGNLGTHIANALMGIGDLIAGAFTADTFGTTLDVVNTTLLGGIVLMIRNFFKKGLSIDLTGGLFDGIKETLGSVTGAFEAMQLKLKADILMKLALAIGVMAGALLVLSMIDPAALTKALGAMGTGFGILIGALAVLMKVMGPAGLVQLYVVTSAVTKMAASILLLAFALRILAGIKMGDMLRGLAGLAGALFIIQKAMIPLAASSKGMARASTSLILLGIALNLIAIAIRVLSTMSWEELARGLVGVAGALAGIGLAMKLMPKGILLQAAGILVLSVAMNALAVAMKIFATMSWGDMAKGAAALAGSLVIIGLAMRLMPASLPLTAAGLLIVSVALNALAAALKLMGGMSWKEIGKGLVTLGGAILILAIGLNAMGGGALLGAAALTVAAGAIALLTPVLISMGMLDWTTILKSLTMLAGIFVVLGLAGFVLAPLVPVILGLGLALTLIGAGLALAGAGALAFATAFGIIVATGTAGVLVLSQMLGAVVSAIPGFFAALGEGLKQFATKVAQSGPAFTKAMSAILSSMLNAVIKNVPKMGRAFLTMLNTALKVITQAAPKIFNAGLKLIIGFLSAIERNIGKIVGLAANIIANFINGVANNLSKIIQAGVNLIIKFIEGVAKAIRNNSERIGAAGADLGLAMVEGMVKGVKGAAGKIVDAAKNVAKSAYEGAKNFLGIGSPSKLMRDEVGKRISQGMALGIRDEAPQVVREVGDMGKLAMSRMEKVMISLEDAMSIDPNLNPTVTPVLDLTKLSREANKMSDILATAPIMAGVSYQTAADISAMTSPPPDSGDGPDGPGSGGAGDTYAELNLHLHSPRPIDSVESYRAGKTLLSLAKESLS